jgi:predicted RNase H-like HicB family nuclease
MKVYQGKTPEDALKLASEELNIPVEDLIYKVEDKRVGIFNKNMLSMFMN